jgi:hypothetical protein
MLPVQTWASPNVQIVLDLAGYLGLAPLAWLLLTRDRLMPSGPLKQSTLLIGGTGAALFAMLIGYVQFNDTYVIALLPFALILIAAELQTAPAGRLWRVATILWSLALIFTVTDLTRKGYDNQQVAWTAADRQVAAGLPFARVAGPKHWAEYHGAFDDWIAAGSPGLHPPPRNLRIGEDPFHDPFYKWLQWRNYENRRGP